MISKIEKRDLVVTILLTIVTCGIYGLYWFIKLTDDAGYASGDTSMSGGVSLLLVFVTCGLYSIYWGYQMGKKIAMAQQKRNMAVQDNSVLYLILSLLGLGIVVYIIAQSELNKIAEFDASQNA